MNYKIKNSPGVTLIEIIVVICIISIFAVILVADFPKIQRQFALSRIAYKFGQDIRRAEDLGLSGVAIKDGLGNSLLAKGYGIFVDRNQQQQYGIYADMGGDTPDYKYDGNLQFCDSTDLDPSSDCIVETIDISKENVSLYIKDFKNINGNYTSINFRPPDPTVNIEGMCDQEIICGHKDNVGIVFGLTTDNWAERIVYINTSGLIEVK